MSKTPGKNTVKNKFVVTAINRYVDFERESKNITVARHKFDRLSSGGIKLSLKSIKDYEINGIKVREYSSEPDAPCLVYFHGGGYVMGGLKSHDILCRRISKFCHLDVVAVEYSLAPENKYPTQLEEGKRVIDKLLSDKKVLYIGGDSAGGNMAAALSTDYIGKARAQILFYPLVDANLSNNSIEGLGIKQNYLTAELLRWFRDQYLPKGCDLDMPKISPKNSLDFMPTFLSIGTRDPLLQEVKEYAQTLETKQIKHQLVIVNHALHGFMQFPKRFGYRKVLDELNIFLKSL